MGYIINDEVYKRINEKVENGTFLKGKDCCLEKYYFEGARLEDFSIDERTPEVCAFLIDYGKCDFCDVPLSSRTREFFITYFTDSGVNKYIKTHISDFDREFFKDLLASNKYATCFPNNCFSIMPLEYIDEEMCSLAILKSLDWSSSAWFYSVYERNPEALTSNLWKLGARLYARMVGNKNEFLDITPVEYKDDEYYKEMCSCNFNCGMELSENKGKIVSSLPKEVLTQEFLLSLLYEDINSIARFGEDELETVISYNNKEEITHEKIWEFIIKIKGNIIQYIELNDERVEFFLKHYSKDSSEYRFYFKDKYRKYKNEKRNIEAYSKSTQRTAGYYSNMSDLTVLGDYDNLSFEEDSLVRLDSLKNIKRTIESVFIPIKYQGIIPNAFRKKYDSEEFLEMLLEKLGIEIVEEFDGLFYRVNLPEGWFVECSGYWNNIKDNTGNIVIKYFYDNTVCDRNAYVSSVNASIELITDNKVMVKK